MHLSNVLYILFAVLLSLTFVPPSSAAPPEPDEATSLEVDRSEGELTLWRQDRKSCSRSTRAVLRSCRLAADDDYWVAFARCLNVADSKEREECLAEANAARREALDLCGEQYEARLEVCELLGEAPYDPEIDPKNFFSPAEAEEHPNPYFPLARGSVWKYFDGTENTVVTVTDKTIQIEGVECFVVNDVVTQGHEPIEDTDDFFAVDRQGAVWYFGEHVENFEDGRLVSLEGSWTAGVDGGKAGIIMESNPRRGDAYRQEFLLGEVEDLGEVVSSTASERTPAASCKGNCVQTHDFTPIEPGVDTFKFYAPNVGLILEVFPDSGEREALTEYTLARPARRAAERGAVEPEPELLSGLRVQDLGAQDTREISFDLARDCEVRVEVFDAAGRRVSNLSRGTLAAGRHIVRWENSRQKELAAGVYFINVRAADQSLTRKVVLLGE